MISSNCPVCNSEKSRFVEEQEANGLLSSLGIKNSFNSSYFSRSSFVLKIYNEWKSQQAFICRR